MAEPTGGGRSAPAPVRLIEEAHARLSRIPDWLVGIAVRVAIAYPFFNSGRLKVEGFTVTRGTLYLFEHEFGLPMPVLAAHLAALAENVLPVLLVAGFATRLSALALFLMTVVIQIVAPEGFWIHLTWFALLLYLVARGPGCLSVDHLIARRFRR